MHVSKHSMWRFFCVYRVYGVRTKQGLTLFPMSSLFWAEFWYAQAVKLHDAVTGCEMPALSEPVQKSWKLWYDLGIAIRKFFNAMAPDGQAGNSSRCQFALLRLIMFNTSFILLDDDEHLFVRDFLTLKDPSAALISQIPPSVHEGPRYRATGRANTNHATYPLLTQPLHGP